jgi:hypothetical protein
MIQPDAMMTWLASKVTVNPTTLDVSTQLVVLVMSTLAIADLASIGDVLGLRLHSTQTAKVPYKTRSHVFITNRY